MKVYLAQLNPKVGDLEGNLVQLEQVLATNTGTDLIVFPELSLTGYPPKDLLLRGDFLRYLQDCLTRLLVISANYPQVALVVGLPWHEGDCLFNSAIVVQAGEIIGKQSKRTLTKFRLFDESRYFSPGSDHVLVKLGEEVVGLALGLELDLELAFELKSQGATLIVNPCAIPFQVRKDAKYREQLRSIAVEAGVPLLRVNQVGGNDELIFAGGSCAMAPSGHLLGTAVDFEAGGTLVDLVTTESEETTAVEDQTAQIYKALVLGLRDYVRKNGMSKVIIGLSGGLDSAVVASLATEALGSENVWGITQPGPYSTPSSVKDAQDLAKNLGIRFDILPIASLYGAMLSALEEHFSGTEMNVAEENIQARLRGNLLMALSNKFGGLVLTNSNKSELSVGYCTLYGDMSGGLAVIADVYKTMVYQLAYYINREREVIPWNTIEKPPSAELRPNQRDDETLPPYDILDSIIEEYLHGGLTPAEIVELGYGLETVQWVTRTIDNNDYKRRQAALILRVTTPVLGYDRQMPLTAKKQFK